MKKIFLVILSALLLSLSFHPLGLNFLAWFGLLPLLYVIHNSSLSKSFFLGWAFGFLFSLFSLFWIVFLQIDVNIKILMLVGMVLMFLYLGLYAASGILFSKVIGLWFLPFIWAGLEYLKGIGELGFPWLSLGYSQARYPLIIQQASIYGIYGISLWLVLLNVALFYLFLKRRLENIISTILIFILPQVFGYLRLRTAPEVNKEITLGVVQPNIDPNLKFTAQMRDETFRRLLRLSEMCQERSPDKKLSLIVWPETATPIVIKTPGAYQDSVTGLADRMNVPILTGTPIYDRKKHEIYNGAVLIEPYHKITQEYKKLHLVPFGEHIPFDKYIPILKKIDFGEGDYSAGDEYTVFSTGELKFSCLICFESIFPEISREFVRRKAELLVNITNDGWFGKISGPQQHNDMAILRAVENGVPLVRSANTGISMVVDQYGRIKKETGLFTEDIITCSLPCFTIKTFYIFIGDLFWIISLFLTPFIAGYKIFVKKLL
ncbi:MAG: apolipoprotein N-acyltransferase [candidate division WOR-3 bacterium]|nr:apolipoprotein N-acyltransferase [candidate division WOR-3 bacterium]